MWKISELFVFALFLLAMSVLSSTAWAAGDGDPAGLDGTIADECGYAQEHVQCNWCWTNCIYALMADAWIGDAAWSENDW